LEVEVHAPVGFDEKLPLRCWVEARRKMDVVKFVAYVPSNQDERGKRAVTNLETLIKEMVKEFEVVTLSKNPSDIVRNVSEIAARVSYALKSRGVVLCLSSGMRHLVVSVLLAALTLEPSSWGKTFIYMEAEGDPTTSYLTTAARLFASLKPLCETKAVEKAIYAVLSEGPLRKTEIWKKVKQMGIEYSKQYVVETINKMIDEDKLVLIKKNGKELVALKDFELNGDLQ